MTMISKTVNGEQTIQTTENTNVQAVALLTQRDDIAEVEFRFHNGMVKVYRLAEESEVEAYEGDDEEG